jgi:2-dehydropantoate 2-reductase
MPFISRKEKGGCSIINILVQVAGALGAYFGGRMLEVGLNVSFFLREKRAAQLTKEGLKINSPRREF